ncbi:HPP family protein [Mycena venus]|uniref:HPP family protein n=1 Tax=Mycena venus TaxID=2733690 RepID=A0A8H7D4E3_9AGAR|nr:HPP family protein [Mycena venus]
MAPYQSLLASLPHWISRWFGYRSKPPPKQPDYVLWFGSFIGAFLGLSVLQAVFSYPQYFLRRHVPSIIASYASYQQFDRRLRTNSLLQAGSAVLCYGDIEAPFAQPRAVMGGHFISALIGVCITKLFGLLPTVRLDQLRWLAGSLSAATAIVVMRITKTTHPPAGATALLAAIGPEVYLMGWYYLPVVLLSSTLVLVSALLVNNIQRRYPVFWWSPAIPAVLKPPPNDLETGIEIASTRPILITLPALPGLAVQNPKLLSGLDPGFEKDYHRSWLEL